MFWLRFFTFNSKSWARSLLICSLIYDFDELCAYIGWIVRFPMFVYLPSNANTIYFHIIYHKMNISYFNKTFMFLICSYQGGCYWGLVGMYWFKYTYHIGLNASLSSWNSSSNVNSIKWTCECDKLCAKIWWIVWCPLFTFYSSNDRHLNKKGHRNLICIGHAVDIFVIWRILLIWGFFGLHKKTTNIL